MQKRRVELVDVDGSGLYVARRLLIAGVSIAYRSLTGHVNILKSFTRSTLDSDSRRMMMNALKSGALTQPRGDSDIGKASFVIISYIHGLDELHSDRDVLGIYKKVARSLQRGAIVIGHGVIKPGFMEEAARILDRHSDKKLAEDFRLYYLPFPPFMGRRIPVGGGELAPEATDLIRLIVGRKKTVIEGLTHKEAEVAAIVRLLLYEARTAAASEAYLLCRNYNVSSKKILTNMMGHGPSLPKTSKIRSKLLELARALELEVLMRPGINDLAYKLTTLIEREVIKEIKEARLRTKKVHVLLVGRSELRDLLKDLPKRFFSFTYIPTSRFFERRLDALKTEDRYDVVVIATRNRHVRRIINSAFKESKIIELDDYSGVGD